MKPNLRQHFLKMFGPTLAGSKIRKLEKNDGNIKVYIHLEDLEIPKSWKRDRRDGYYVLQFHEIQKMNAEFLWLEPKAKKQLEEEGNLIHDYGFLETDFLENPEKILKIYFNTDGGFLEIHAKKVDFEL